jgi:hypothetical protein
MSWRYREPQRKDYETEEEFEDAIMAYESALSFYEDVCKERYYERGH